MSLIQTPHQTFGPYFRIGLEHFFASDFAGNVAGARVTITGRVLDGDGKPVSDAGIEIWQADARGKYAHPDDKQNKTIEPGFRGFGRVATDDEGRFRFSTIKPGRVAGPRGVLQAPHLAVIVGMRGLLKHLVTRIYFPDDPSNAEDPILNLVPAERRTTLIAKKGTSDSQTLEWNVMLQGADETVFFDY